MHALASLDSLLQGWVGTYGLIAILLLMTVQCVGVPFPSEVIMPVAGYLASTGSLNLVAVIAVGIVGNLIGSLIAYGLAAWLGEPVLLGPGRYIGIRRDHVEIADRWFRRHGTGAVFWGRFLPVIRTYISFPAGLARIRLDTFTVMTFLGTLPWTAALAIAGYEGGKNWNRVAGPIGIAGLVLAVVLVLVVIGWFVRGRRRPAIAGSEATPAGPSRGGGR
ncbi:MAG: DedA family protein [Candidatus Dormiibacterota bacterium]|jgi:membrane protein DedA with SNARE-associated domain